MMRTRFDIAAVSFVLVAGGLAQTSRGTVSGIVTDSSGAVLGGAQIALIHTQNGVRRSAVSNEAGIYRFDAVDLGLYELKIEQAGSRRFVITEVRVEANRTTTIEVRLEFRWEALNAFNHPQFIEVPERDVLGAPPGRFLNRDFTNSGIRSMWVQVKPVF